MNIEEVIEQLEDLKEYCSKSVRGKADAWYKDVEALDKVIEIAEKEVPARPKLIRFDGLRESGRCINCGTLADEFEHYCSECGQKLDWEG